MLTFAERHIFLKTLKIERAIIFVNSKAISKNLATNAYSFQQIARCY
jgi:hypothetical protein